MVDGLINEVEVGSVFVDAVEHLRCIGLYQESSATVFAEEVLHQLLVRWAKDGGHVLLLSQFWVADVAVPSWVEGEGFVGIVVEDDVTVRVAYGVGSCIAVKGVVTLRAGGKVALLEYRIDRVAVEQAVAFCECAVVERS